MLIKNYQMTFFIFLVVGTVMAVSANSWFTCWLGLEINLMSFIPLILSNLNNSTTEAAIKYFLVQAMASVFLIFFASAEPLNMAMNFNSMMNPVIFMAMATKAGMAPFHFWFPQIMIKLPWMHCAIVLIWQKIAPFVLMSYFSSSNTTIFFILVSAAVGSLGGLNQTLTKMILTYSSIAHSSWMLMLSSISIYFWANYYLIYSLISTSLIMPFYLMNMNSFTDISKNFSSKIFKLSLIFSVMSLGGLPPLLGFSAKFLAIKLSLYFFPVYVILILILSSLISLFYYFKMIYSSLFLNTYNFKMIKPKNFTLVNIFLYLSMAGNLIIPYVVLLT
uniref:NADH-ubiquinone oxidoreductase chain 2 n=1 Tax=Cryptopygus antarcticus TaxID=187623 RepID=B2BSB2_CRYAT|nr:NADH dehydrogenase subunit 2 [Cryptopygus antarcticus]ABS57565.1 NADH dehydrogenase subunit 2 [Cryptopygus antarcticus]